MTEAEAPNPQNKDSSEPQENKAEPKNPTALDVINTLIDPDEE